MPWVLVQRAGSAGGNSGRAGSRKHTQTITRFDVGGASSLLGAFGGDFGWGKNVIRV